MSIKHPHVICSLTRTGFYGSLAAVFGLTDAETIMVVDAIILGIVMGDYGTWFCRTIVLLPVNMYFGLYTGVVNILFGFFYFSYLPDTSQLDPSSVAIGFASTLVVVAIKVFAYALELTKQHLM